MTRICIHNSKCECAELGGKGPPLTWLCPVLDKEMNASWTRLCRTRQDYFELWKDGTVYRPAAVPVAEVLPLRTQVVSFLTAMAHFARDGFRVVDDEEFDLRVGICEACGLFDRRTGRCSVCGCKGKLKARGRVWACPKGKW